jgi:hypothetical protein
MASLDHFTIVPNIQHNMNQLNHNGRTFFLPEPLHILESSERESVRNLVSALVACRGCEERCPGLGDCSIIRKILSSPAPFSPTVPFHGNQQQ